MTRSVLCLRGNGPLRISLLPATAGSGSGAQVAGSGATHKHVTQTVDPTQLEHACVAVLSALQRGQAVCESDALRQLDKTDVEGTPLQRACLWRAALQVLVATGHAVRSGLWYTVRAMQCMLGAGRLI